MKILLIHTGGTIGMVQSDAGFAPQDGLVEQQAQIIAAKFPGVSTLEIMRLDPLIDSAQATPADWNRISQTIFQARDRYDGFIVTHGTDTLPYTAAALCLALTGLQQPVILTGSMIPLSVKGSDGYQNLLEAFVQVLQGKAGVWVQFAGKTMHGALTRKLHSNDLDAFEAELSPAAPRIAADTPILMSTRPKRIGVFSIVPGPCIDILSYIIDECDGVVIRCYGSGTAPETPELKAALNKAVKKEVPVLAVSQCPRGGMKFGTYAAGKILRDNHVIEGHNMTPEMAYVKLHYALSAFHNFTDTKEYLKSCLCGEFGAH